MRFPIQRNIFLFIYSTILIILLSRPGHAISIKPADFDRLIMPCYLGGAVGSGFSGSAPYGAPPSISSAQTPLSASSAISSPGLSNGYSYGASPGRSSSSGQNVNLGSNGGLNSAYQPTYYGADSSRTPATYSGRDSLSNLGQQVPRANTVDNFIALVSKIEAANPRLANNPDQLIRVLLGRFHMDNYYYDVRSKTPISEQDHRTLDLTPAILNSFNQQQVQGPYVLSSDTFPEHLLDHDEKCSMYFMLSHFIDKSNPSSPPLASTPVVQLTGPNGGQKPPVLQAAGTGYPGQSANNAFNGNTGNGNYRYSGPSPSFGSPATSNMNSFGSGISNTPEYTGNNPYGVNVLQPNSQFNQNYNNLRNTGQYSGTLTSNSRYSTPIVDGQGRSRNERQALEHGVVTVANQENAAIVLNRVLMGLLAAATPPQTIRQLSGIVYPTQALGSTVKTDEEIDPLYAVTLADLWAVGSIPKPGRGVDPTLLGDNGHWNDTMCPTSFVLDRASSIKFTTAELLGGLDGFNLGMFRRRLMSMRKNMRLSELLRMYYSKTGFRPQFAEVGVCNRANAINTQLDDIRRQAENYLRLYQLNTPISDQEIAGSIFKLEAFKDLLRQAANQYSPPEVCLESSFSDTYPLSQQDQCEISKADVSVVLDSSPQANEAFMNLFVAKFAQKLGLSRQSNSLSVLTNQQDTTGYAGAYSFNAIVRNSSNTAEIGCALIHDTTRSYQGGQITDPTRLVEMFERCLVNLDSEYLVRQNLGSPTSSNKQSSYISSLFGQSADNPYVLYGVGPRNTGGSKVIIWFNYNSQLKASPIASSATNWNSQNYNDQYKFNEAKKYLRENFRGASILAVSNSRDDVKDFVYDQERDIFTDVPPGNGISSSSSSYDYSLTDPSNMATLSGPADQLVSKLLQRMCDIPALFQYPMCFRAPSDNTQSVGYISPGRKQYWMMSPKTFFASRSVRMVFKVEGGRLRVCFGRMTKPDESAYKYQQQYPSSITFSTAVMKDGQVLPSATQSSSSNDYYTGLNYGICKDVSPGQEIDFTVDDPCYKKPIAECEPFYYVINEISNIGETDPNYMCKDEGCKRFDQAKFVMTHTGVTCSSAYKSAKANWLLIAISVITTLFITQEAKQSIHKISKLTIKKTPVMVASVSTLLFYFIVQQVHAQQAGVHDFGQNRAGEKRGNFTPSEVLAIVLLVMIILAGLAFTIGLCYYVTKRNSRGMTKVEQDGY